MSLLYALLVMMRLLNIHFVEFIFVAKSTFCRIPLRHQCGRDDDMIQEA